MKRLIFLATLTYILPKEKPLYDGMIVRCDQPKVIYSIGSTTGPTLQKQPTQYPCHWECEFGQITETYVEDGNQRTRAVRCSEETYTAPGFYHVPTQFL